MAATETGGTFGPGTQVIAPSNADSSGALLNGVSCTSPGACTAVGSYTANSQTQQLAMAVTSTGHIAPSGGAAQSFHVNSRTGFETRPAGNAVSLEDEMIKVAANQMDYQAATALYSRSLGLIKTALGRG